MSTNLSLRFLLHSLVHKGSGCATCALLLYLIEPRRGVFSSLTGKTSLPERVNVPNGAGRIPSPRSQLRSLMAGDTGSGGTRHRDTAPACPSVRFLSCALSNA